MQVEEGGGYTETTRLFPNEWAGTDAKKEVDEKTLLSVRCDVRNNDSTPSAVTLDPTAPPERRFDTGAHAHAVRQRYGYMSERYSPSDENRHLSYIRISRAYASVNDETESDNREDYTRMAREYSKPVKLQYTRSNVAHIPDAYHNVDATYVGYSASSKPMYACGKRCFNSNSDANNSDDGCDVAKGNGHGDQCQNDARHLANGVSDPNDEYDGAQVASHKQAALVLKKVTLQDSTGDSDSKHPVASTVQRPVSAVKGARPVQKPDAPVRTSEQQNRESRTNQTKTGSGIVWPSGKQDQGYFSIRDLFPTVDKVSARRSFPQRGSRPLGSVVIDDSNHRETKFLNKERLTADTGRSFTMREGIEHLRQKERLQVGAQVQIVKCSLSKPSPKV